MKKLVWRHKKYGKRDYAGSYTWGFISNLQTERVFILKWINDHGKSHLCVFESHEAAKMQGWVGK